ncbi:PP2C family protein-serine/threonine phosphatase [Aporhodopirellula aestuarii]|uniref:Protein phosphatase 2C domain-containing protein n=1 Tax=Aporhodopirellula aestuarii TaxID=2950107 RepID=A0ABT0U6H8_9BACT|nr:protein phosphatase 2C domain-containing protein [Aporhodopirellula aestuarii]MCM2372553.1 protein phosphatase 2C domain-containing protein [Aporhodopirellula aestuarii]
MTAILDSAVQYYLESEMDAPVVIRDAQGNIVAYSRTCPGKEDPNDDSAVVIRIPNGGLVLAVADGVGGAPVGYKASAIAVQCLAESIAALDSTEDLRPAILDGIEKANEEILDMGTGAATTICVVEVHNRLARGYQVGDSMAIFVGGRGAVKWKSTSHSPVGYAIESGMLDEEDAMHHDERHIVSNLVGSRTMHIEIGPAIPLAPRDTVLIASDGLFDNLHLSEICQLARVGQPLDRMNALIRLASDRMNQASPESPGKPDDLAMLLLAP